jgi:threonylcarbamoyladenosine tRNA methylthiotransferase MtaB
LDETLAEARRIVGSGCGEVVLTGTHLGMYGRDIGASLTKLVRQISALPGLTRLRLGSMEPFALLSSSPEDGLLDALAESPAFCPHLHLPLQSGDDEILARMRRGHAADDFARVCERAREKLGDDLHISSDVLVGFPGESDAAYRRTLDLMRRTALGRVHVFPYSPRKGTEAAGFPDRVPPGVASERVEGAISLGTKLLKDYASRFVGRDLPVLAEKVEENFFRGYTRNFISAVARFRPELFPGEDLVSAGKEITIRVTGWGDGELQGLRT